jgi:hypothetical protein
MQSDSNDIGKSIHHKEFAIGKFHIFITKSHHSAAQKKTSIAHLRPFILLEPSSEATYFYDLHVHPPGSRDYFAPINSAPYGSKGCYKSYTTRYYVR